MGHKLSCASKKYDATKYSTEDEFKIEQLYYKVLKKTPIITQSDKKLFLCKRTLKLDSLTTFYKEYPGFGAKLYIWMSMQNEQKNLLDLKTWKKCLPKLVFLSNCDSDTAHHTIEQEFPHHEIDKIEILC